MLLGIKILLLCIIRSSVLGLPSNYYVLMHSLFYNTHIYIILTQVVCHIEPAEHSYQDQHQK